MGIKYIKTTDIKIHIRFTLVSGTLIKIFFISLSNDFLIVYSEKLALIEL